MDQILPDKSYTNSLPTQNWGGERYLNREQKLQSSNPGEITFSSDA